MRRLRRLPARLTRPLRRALPLLALVLACRSTAEPAAPLRLQLVTPVRPLGVPGWPLLDTLTVQVLDDAGRARGGKLVTWAVPAGGGTLTVVDTVTDPAGIARAVWTLGPAAGLNRVRVETADDSLSITVTGMVFQVDALDSDAGLACGLRAGDLWCWPWPNGPSPYSAGPALTWGTTFGGPTEVVTGRHFSTLAVTGGWACGLPPSGLVECYGWGAVPQRFDPAVPPLRSLAGSGFGTICGLAVADSTPWCWSSLEGAGSIRHVTPSPPLVDLTVDDGASGLVGIACGRRVDSTAVCWGLGPVGDSTTQNRAAPVAVAGGLTFVELATGHGFACGRRPSGEVWCWGTNTYQVLGSPGPTALVPRLAATGITRLRAAGYTVGVLQGSQVARWGFFQYGDPAGNPLTPLAPFTAGQVADFSGDDISCLRAPGGEVSCYHELWVFSSTIDIDTYLPVQPVPAQAPATATR